MHEAEDNACAHQVSAPAYMGHRQGVRQPLREPHFAYETSGKRKRRVERLDLDSATPGRSLSVPHLLGAEQHLGSCVVAAVVVVLRSSAALRLLICLAVPHVAVAGIRHILIVLVHGGLGTGEAWCHRDPGDCARDPGNVKPD